MLLTAISYYVSITLVFKSHITDVCVIFTLKFYQVFIIHIRAIMLGELNLLSLGRTLLPPVILLLPVLSLINMVTPAFCLYQHDVTFPSFAFKPLVSLYFWHVSYK